MSVPSVTSAPSQATSLEPSLATTSVVLKAKRLSHLLLSASVKLPIFTRLQIQDEYLTRPLASLSISGQGIQAVTTEGRQVQIAWEDLIDIVAFVDGQGKPVFLTEISNVGAVANDWVEYVDQEQAKGQSLAVKYQDVYVDRYQSTEESRWLYRRYPKSSKDDGLRLMVFNEGSTRARFHPDWIANLSILSPHLSNRKPSKVICRN